MTHYNLKRQYKANKELLKHYKELFEASINELQFSNLQIEFLKNTLNEVLNLNNQKVNPKLIKQVIDNAIERHYLDKLIHNNLIGKN